MASNRDCDNNETKKRDTHENNRQDNRRDQRSIVT